MKATPRANTGPGRSKRPGGAGVRPQLTPKSAATPSPAEELNPTPPRKPGGPLVTRRAFIMILIVVVLALSYANTLRIYIGQQHDLALAEQQIRDRTAQITHLEGELDRWNDPEYVKTQARERLGWVMPGETGFRVIGENGEPLGGGVVIEGAGTHPEGEYSEVWWNRLWDSIKAADAPQRKVVNR